MNNLALLPIIPDTKGYWLVRTQGGRYYSDYRKNGFIAINWDDITVDNINELSDKELVEMVKSYYPDKPNASRTANQLRIFAKNIKKGDVVLITGYSSNVVSVGEVLDDQPFVETIEQAALEEDPKKCPFQKRKRVKWLKDIHKWDLDKELYKLLQHAQHTISEADEYANAIERLIHNFFIRGNEAHLALQVKKEGKIPMPSFFLMGAEIIELAEEFNDFSETYDIDLDGVDLKVNVNSPGKITFTGPIAVITVIGLLLLTLNGGSFSIPLQVFGGEPVSVNMNGMLKEITDFWDHKQSRDQKELILKTYMADLEVKTPEELAKLLEAVDPPASSEKTSEK
ncbi:hypothetical protein [Paenibacillus caseinilyticus]|uniref:hypothetical protein n=1 Tax=Paenibacillus caseinilyticus TaxID=3098138 RepID=UPI0022B90A7C|nr:hypothetical protein [Paenibacillus caseinilyticus]MCZ8518904.1 hypothetical protein [Paenibacillus caseinilyticus]